MLLKDISLVDENFEAHPSKCLVIEGTAITYIGDEPPADYRGEIYDGRGKIALPGFFNLHCHSPMTLIRGYGEGLPLHQWLNERMFPYEALLTPEDMYWGAILGMAEMLRSGAVSFSEMYMKLEAICRAISETGMKANLCNAALNFNDDARFVGSSEWNDAQTVLDFVKNAGHDRIAADVGIHAEYTTRERLVRDVAEYALENGMRLQVHVSETKTEHEECKARHGGKTPAQWLLHCGVFQAPVTAAHCVHIEGDDFAILAENGATVAHCPSSNLKLGSGIAPLRKMLDSGVRIGIGTDGAASNNNLNMLEEINLASMVQKGVTGDPVLFGPKQMLEMACRTGAAAQGREDCGCIRVGNRADLVLVDLYKPHLQPVFDPLANILYAAQAGDICMTIVDGRVLYKDGAYATIDIEQAMYHANRIKNEKLAQLSR